MSNSTRKLGGHRRVTKTVLDTRPGSSSHARGLRVARRKSMNPRQLGEEGEAVERRVREIYKGINPETVALVRARALQDDNGDSSMMVDSGGYTAEGWTDEIPVEEEFMHALKDIQQLPWANSDTVKTKTTSVWKQRRLREEAAWAPLIEDLTDKFMQYRYRARSSLPTPATSGPDSPPSRSTSPMDEHGEYYITVSTFNLFTRVAEVTVTLSPEHASPAIDLAAHGWIAKTPERPTVAVSISTLQLLHRLRQRKPSFSVEAFAKVVCDYYMIPFRAYIRRVFADTYEIYVRLLRREQKRVRAVLGWDTADWRPLNACRPCCYVLKDEPSMRFSRMLAMDGNNSLKRMLVQKDRVAGDTRVLEDGTYFLPNAYVNIYANEVKGRQSKGPAVQKRTRAGDTSEDESDGENEAIVEGDPTDGVARAPGDTPNSSLAPDATSSSAPADTVAEALQKKITAECIKNWKAASAEENKKMWSVFDEAGVFASACRHGLIMWVMDMVKSGELAKYPLATIAKILEKLPPGALVGYDIGCSFNATALYSSLREALLRKDLHFCVNAFHGYTHSHLCQLQYHPNNIPGTGIEDLETLERVFSSSNQLASVIRYTSPYRRRLLIEAHYEQWDDEKYQNLGTFLLGNYKQALSIAKFDGAAVDASVRELGVSDEVMDQWAHEEREFFATLGNEAESDVHAVAYVELLQQLRALDMKRLQTSARFVSYAPTGEPNQYETDTALTRRIEADRRHTRQEHARVNLEVCELEVKMGITDRWNPATPEYVAAMQYLTERRYRRALDKLQRLVVLRLFELHKLNVSQTGYKLRAHISKSLQVRCKTIRKAVTAYNLAAAALNPPRPPLDWSVVSSYGFIEEFTLLQDTHNDIRDRQWSKPNVRATLKLRNRVARAKEELVRLNIESRRLHTAILDEDILFDKALARLEPSSPLHGALLDFATRRRSVNADLLDRIEQIYNLDGFTGQREPGEAVENMNDVFMAVHAQAPPDSGNDVEVNTSENGGLSTGEPSSGVDSLEDDGLGSEDDDSGDDDDQHQRGQVVEFVSVLALQ